MRAWSANLEAASVGAMIELEVRPEEDGLRADAFVAGRFPEASRAEIRELLAAGEARVGRRPLKKGGRVAAGEHITLAREPTAKGFAPAAYAGPELALVLEHGDFLVVDKPAGMPAHPLRGDEAETVANWVASRFPECVEAGSAPREAGLVHRIDNDTSGLLLVARSRAAHDALRAAWDEVDKEYQALVHGRPLAPQLWAMPIVHQGKTRMEALLDERDVRAAEAKPAMTEVLRASAREDGLTEITVRIHRGQRHQIRVHAAAAGFPLVGDTLYGAPEGDAPHHRLHASALEFRWGEETIRVEHTASWE